MVDGEPKIINISDDEQGKVKHQGVPSVVAYDDDGSLRIGHRALDGMTRNTRRTVFGAKRFIGRQYDSPAVHQMLSRFPYKVVPGPNGRVAVEINGRPVNLATVSSKVLHHIRDAASKVLGQPVNRAIITVPAFYNENQRDAVVQAGRLAGFTVERIINEPTAAAVAYGLMHAKPRRLIVYDLGGGTFDVSVMSVHKDALQVRSTAGDTFLGGEDFDNVIVDFVLAEHERTRKKKDAQLSTNFAARALIKAAAEQAKIRLSTRETTTVVVREAIMRDGSTGRLEVDLSREQLEKVVSPLINRTLKICDMALREAQLKIDDIADVILVGGMTRMPIVQASVEKHFNLKPRNDLNPDEVVALGACMLANLPPGSADKLQDVLSMTIGIGVEGRRFKPLIPRNSPLPTVKSFNLKLPRSQIASYKIEFWQGEDQELHKNEFLGALSADVLDPGMADPVPLKVEIGLTADCLLKVRLTNLATKEAQHVILETRDS